MDRCLGWIAGLALAGLISFNVYILREQLADQRVDSESRSFWRLCQSDTPIEERGKLFLKLAASGHSEWRSANLLQLSLDGVDLSECDLRRATFDDCDFEKADFSKAKMQFVRLDVSGLNGATFRQAELKEAILFKSELRGADFATANLTLASLEQADAREARFMLADMTGAYLLMTRLEDADLSGANLTDATLSSADFSRANMSLTRVANTNIENATFTDSNWWRARGWTSDQLDYLLRTFPPGADSSEKRIEDFERWLAEREAQSQ